MKLFEDRLHDLLNIVHNPGLPTDLDDLIDSQDGAVLVLQVARGEHAPELIEESVITILLILRQILLQLPCCLHLRLFFLELRDDPGELSILKYAIVPDSTSRIWLKTANGADLAASDELSLAQAILAWAANDDCSVHIEGVHFFLKNIEGFEIK